MVYIKDAFGGVSYAALAMDQDGLDLAPRFTDLCAMHGVDPTPYRGLKSADVGTLSDRWRLVPGGGAAKSWDAVLSGDFIRPPLRGIKLATAASATKTATTLRSEPNKYWQFVPDDQIGAIKRIRAYKALYAACERLRLGDVALRFVRELPSAAGANVILDCSEPGAHKGFATYDGLASKGVYLVDVNTDEDTIIRDVAHEVRHVWHASWDGASRATAEIEQDCRGWAAQFEEDYNDGKYR